VPPAFDQSIEDIRQIKNQESQNQTASINFSSREDFQTIIDQMVGTSVSSKFDLLLMDAEFEVSAVEGTLLFLTGSLL
jgi:hypothetical protein